MKVCLYIGNIRNEDIGGGYVFFKNVLDAFTSYSNPKYELYAIYYSSKDFFYDNGNIKFINLMKSPCFYNLKIRIKRKIKTKIVNFLRIFDLHFITYESLNYKPTFNDFLKKYQIDLVYFFTPNYEVTSVPYFFTVWDLEHKNYPFLPEITINNEFDNREKFYKNVLPKAAKIIIGNNVGKQQLIDYYLLPEKLIRTIPLPLPNDLSIKDCNNDILSTLNINRNEYLFYPAQFWSHKNHIILIKKFREIKKIKQNLKIVFSGSDKGNLNYIRARIKQLNLEKDIIYAGFLPRKDVICLYINAFALVYPSLFGPDNIPPIEAMALNCPVICADNKGMRLQLENNALFFDPITGDGLIDCLAKLEDVVFRKKIISSAYEFVNKYSVNNYIENIYKLFDEYSNYLELWKSE